MNVLIVEDESGTVKILKKMIEQYGYQCHAACSGREAVEKIYQAANKVFYNNIMIKDQYPDDFPEKIRKTIDNKKQYNFDLVLLNIWLPDIKGYDLIPEFKRYFPDLKIIAMTALNDRELEKKIRRQGVIYYLIKPLELYQLKEILEHILKKSEQEGFINHTSLANDNLKQVQRKCL